MDRRMRKLSEPEAACPDRTKGKLRPASRLNSRKPTEKGEKERHGPPEAQAVRTGRPPARTGGELRGRQQNGPVSARKRGAADRPGSAPKSDGREMILKKI